MVYYEWVYLERLDFVYLYWNHCSDLLLFSEEKRFIVLKCVKLKQLDYSCEVQLM